MADKIDRILQNKFRIDPCYIPALLKLSSELKGEPDEKLDELLESTLSESNLSQEDLESYIKMHKPELMEEAKKIIF
jgi:hypothetical protein